MLQLYFRRAKLTLNTDRVTVVRRLEAAHREHETAHANYCRELAAVNTLMAVRPIYSFLCAYK